MARIRLRGWHKPAYFAGLPWRVPGVRITRLFYVAEWGGGFLHRWCVRPAR